MKYDVICFWAGLIGLTIAGCNSCTSTPPAATPASIAWSTLVDAGCAAPDIAGPTYVALQLEAGAPAWLTCLSQGGSVAACSVPCK
jgi:hypothetical protein